MLFKLSTNAGSLVKKGCAMTAATDEGLTDTLLWSMIVSRLWRSGSRVRLLFLTFGCYFQNESGFFPRILKFKSLTRASLNGGAPKARMNRITPREKISAGMPE